MDKYANKILLILLGIYQIFGGLFGITAVFEQSIFYILHNFIYFIIIIGLFIFSIVCGIYLLKVKYQTLGIKYSFINQFLQLIQFEILGNGLFYVAGCYLAIGFSDSPQMHLFKYFAIFKGCGIISFLVDSNEITFSINLVALIFLIYLNYLYKQKNRSKLNVT